MKIEQIYLDMADKFAEDIGKAHRPENRDTEKDKENLRSLYGDALKLIEYEGDMGVVNQMVERHLSLYDVRGFLDFLPYMVQGAISSCCGEMAARLIVKHSANFNNWSEEIFESLSDHETKALKTVTEAVSMLKTNYDRNLETKVLNEVVENWPEKKRAALAKKEEASKGAMTDLMAELENKYGFKAVELPGNLGFVMARGQKKKEEKDEEEGD